MKLIYISLFCFLIFWPIMAQSAPSELPYTSIQKVPQSTWDQLAQKKIFFGHHSVGENILQGLKTLLAEHPNIHLKIINSKEMGNQIARPSLVEGPVGRNFYPYTKLNAFKEKIEAGYGETADIVFFKFCFVDFNPETEINALFTNYRDTLDDLRKKYPDTTFAVISAPLTCYAPGFAGLEKRAKDIIKKIIGKLNIYDYKSANRFNELLTKEYKGKVPFFDLARYESTRPDGSRNSTIVDGQQNFELVQGYTTDGGHLNTIGQKLIAEQFLLFLANTAEKK